MGLTRIRADQISNIDYKQAVRVITVSNVTLSGGAPSTVDGVSLSAGDRVLVQGQSTGSQNGIYVVSTLGTGSNGTWARSADGNENGEIEAGMIIMVTEGDTYKDTQWKLTTNNPITIGTTALVFEQNSAFAFGNVYANGTAILASSVGDTIELVAGTNITITGNGTAKTVTFAATGALTPTLIESGTSNVNVTSSGGNITVGVGGTDGIAVFSTSGIEVTGNLSPSANITYDLGNTNNRWRDLWLSNSTIYLGNAQISANATALTITNPAGGTTVLSGATPAIVATTVSATGNIQGGNLRTAGLISASGTVTGTTFVGVAQSATTAGTVTSAAQGNITSVGTLTSLSVSGNVQGGNLRTAGLVSATGNITGNYIIGNGSQLTGLPAGYANSDVATYLASGTVTTDIKTTGAISATGNVTGGNLLGTIATASQTNITAVGTLTSLSVSGNVQGGNLRTAGLISATGTVTGTTFIGVAQSATTAGTVTTAAQGNITSVGTLTSLSVSGNVQGGNLQTAGLVSATGTVTGSTFVGNGSGLSAIAGANVTGTVANAAYATSAGSASTATTAGTVTTAAQGNITSVGTLTSLSVSGNVQGGNLRTAGLVSATGTVTGSTFVGSGASLTAIPGGNVTGTVANASYATSAGSATTATTAGTVTTAAQANITSVGTLTSLSVSGNVQGGNLRTAGLISATGTVTGTTFIGIANQAKYADLAEYYIADADYPVGTVLEFGGNSEVTQSTTSHITSIAGTVSDQPAYIMNSGLDHPHRTPVALTGRVPCRVVGTIRKGDRLAASDISGVATALDPAQYQPGCIIGKALEDYNSDEPGIIEVVVGRL